jgi:2-polyprenyl-3-methyl-5-hydroxy-6-metoxy-1,4-benzoquinol methylase
MNFVDTEKAKLEAIASDSWYSRGVNTDTIHYSHRVFRRFWRQGKCLEMGPAEGVMTALLAKDFDDLSVVEGSGRFCEALRQRHPKIKVHHALFEEFAPTERYDTIVLGHVLEHVAKPRDILARAKEWLAPNGVICAAVPNARSLHRQAAVMMGILATEHTLNETDKHHGHERVYDPESFRADFLGAGLKVKVFGGYWLKPLSNAQIEATWTPQMLEAFMQLGERYPDIAGEIYVVAGRE